MGNKKLNTKVYFKATDTHALLHKDSFHPKHTFKGIVKSQLIRFHRICTDPKDVEEATSVLFKALRSRGYSRTFLRAIKMNVLRNYVKENNLKEKKIDEPRTMIPLVLTFSSPSLVVNKKVKENFSSLQDNLEEFQNSKIITAFRRNKNLKDSLVHASFKTERAPREPYQRKTSSFLFNSYTKLGAPILQNIRLETPNSIYVIECKKCNLLYIGQTKHTIRKRLKQHILYYED